MVSRELWERKQGLRADSNTLHLREKGGREGGVIGQGLRKARVRLYIIVPCQIANRQ